MDQEKVELFQTGDHVWCHTRLLGRYTIQHHGISDGRGGVYHFDSTYTKKPGDIDSYYVYENCPSCTAITNHRQNLRLRDRSVRFSCLKCFSRGRNVYCCEYDAGVLSQIWRETGSRSTKPCLRSGEEVVAVAEGFYRENNFGKYEVLTHNCEDFARWCKIGKLGSKQATRALVLAGFATGSVVRTSGTLGFCKVVRKYDEWFRLEELERRNRFAERGEQHSRVSDEELEVQNSMTGMNFVLQSRQSSVCFYQSERQRL